MSPGNRSNPDTTHADGSFGWDAVAGYYEVQATASGCVSAADHSNPVATSSVVELPPPATNLVITMYCGEVTPPPSSPGPAGQTAGTKSPSSTSTSTSTSTTKTSTVTPPVIHRAPSGCAALKAAAAQSCLATQAHTAALDRCTAIKGKGKAARKARTTKCVAKANLAYKRALALIKCQSLKNKHKRSVCMAKARKLKLTRARPVGGRTVAAAITAAALCVTMAAWPRDGPWPAPTGAQAAVTGISSQDPAFFSAPLFR